MFKEALINSHGVMFRGRVSAAGKRPPSVQGRIHSGSTTEHHTMRINQSFLKLVRQSAWIACLCIAACAQTDREVSRGADLYAQCMGCHSPAWHRTGPRHCGLIGRRAGSVEGFEFTQAMKNSGIIWTQETLDRFLKSPLTYVPGTSMGFAGIAAARERQQLITYLAQLDENNPVCR